MSSEQLILNKLNNLSANFIIALYETRLLLNDVKRDIKKMNNTYFEENPEIIQRLDDIMSEKSLKELGFLLSDFKTYIEYKNSNCCEHQWTKDLIDIDPDRSKEIIYCIKCDITKK